MSLWQKGLRMAIGKMPKIIDPTTHAVLDCVVAGSFVVMGVVFWNRRKRASIGSLLCGGAAVANIMLTDYSGNSRKLISYKAHERVDMGLAGMTAAIPGLLRFGDKPESRFFEIKALAETAIIGLTDFDHYEDSSLAPMLRDKQEG